MEGSAKECEKYGATIRVSKSLDSLRHSIVYNGSVCPIDIKGVSEVEANGAGLNIRNSIMEKIFDVDMATPAGGDRESGSGHNDDSDHEAEEERYRFWVEINVFKNEDEGQSVTA